MIVNNIWSMNVAYMKLCNFDFAFCNINNYSLFEPIIQSIIEK